MAKLSTFKCDVCGKVKGETNHWLVMFLLAHKVEILPFSAPFDTGVEKPGAVHLCGSGCAMKKLADRLSRENFAADARQLPTVLDDEPVVTDLLGVAR